MNTVLFVDDEKLITNSLKRGLMDQKYKRLFANSGEEALRLMENNDVSVLVTDMKMPKMNGLELLKIVKERYPDIVKIVLSGYTQLPQVLITVNQGDIFKFITKPWDLEKEFIGVIQEAIDFYNYKIQIKQSKEALEFKNKSFQNILKTYDDKVIEIKDEIDSFKVLNLKVFEGINHILRNKNKLSESEIIREVMVIENISIRFLNALPSIANKTSLTKYIDGLKQFAKDEDLKLKLDVGVDSSLERVYKAYFGILSVIIKTIFKDLVYVENIMIAKIVVTSETIEKNVDYLKFLIEFDEKYMEYNETNKIIIEILEQYSTKMDMKFNLKNIKGKNIFIISIKALRY